ncbi:uncharacterized protein LOC112040585 [Quercus suber]|uniref:uncharacterized protein LOC112040585 n=1 Tax=Quercus suber TaxID=58331 RepID=UPI0032DF97B2
MFSSISGGSTGITTANLTAASILPSLQFILQQNSTQRVSMLSQLRLSQVTCCRCLLLPPEREICSLRCFICSKVSGALLRNCRGRR